MASTSITLRAAALGASVLSACAPAAPTGASPPIANVAADASASPSSGSGRDPNVMAVTPREPSSGDMDRAIIKRQVKRHLASITACYEQARVAAPQLRGTVTATFIIGPGGRVQASRADGVDVDLAACVADVMRAIEFPKPMGSSVRVVYPFDLSPDGR